MWRSHVVDLGMNLLFTVMKESSKQIPHAHFECLMVGLAACLRSASHYRVTDIPETAAYFSPATFENREKIAALLWCALGAATDYPEDSKRQAVSEVWPFVCAADIMPELDVDESRGSVASHQPSFAATSVPAILQKRVVAPHFVLDPTAPGGMGFERLVLRKRQHGVGEDLSRLVVSKYERILIGMCRAVFEESRRTPLGVVFVQSDQGRPCHVTPCLA